MCFWTHQKGEDAGFGKIIRGKIMRSFYDFARHDFAAVFIQNRECQVEALSKTVNCLSFWNNRVKGLIWRAGGDILLGKDGRKPFHFMNRFTRAWKAGVKAYREGVVPDCPTPAEYQCGGHFIYCPQCKGERFMMSPPSVFSWAFVLTCDKCGFMQRYGKAPEIRVA